MELHLSPLKTKVLGELVFEAESPLHIGAGGEEIRKSLLRLLDGSPFIPSSSWKGAFRALAEKIAKSMEFEGLAALAVTLYHEHPISGINYRAEEKTKEKTFQSVVDAIKLSLTRMKSSPLCDAEEVKLLFEQLGYEEEIEALISGDEFPATVMADALLAIHCPIGGLLGNRLLAGKLRFIDSIIETIRAEERAGVGIDRKSGRIEERHLYFLEITPRDIRVRLRMIADNLHPGADDARLLAATLQAIRLLGLQLGGQKSRGLGRLTLIEEKAHFHIIDLEDDKNPIGAKLCNPIQKIKPSTLEGFIHWLKGY